MPDKSFTFAAVNASDSPRTKLGVFPVLAPEAFAKALREKNPFARGTEQDNQERFARLMQTPDAQDMIAGRVWLGPPESVELFVSPETANVRRIKDDKKHDRIVPTTGQGEEFLKSLGARSNRASIDDDLKRWKMQKFEGTKSLEGSNVFHRVMVSVHWSEPHMAVALEVIHHDCERMRTIGSFRFVFLPQT